MYQLLARKRPKNGYATPSELICVFDDFSYRFTAIDFLDRDVYEEAVIIDDNYHCVMYVKFEETLKRKRDRK